MRYFLALSLVAVLVFRTLGLGEIPNGYAWDEMDNAYQAYSLVTSGRDMFGNPLPVLVHSLADYKSSLYVYLATPWVYLWGPSVIASRTPALLGGVIAVGAAMILVGKRWGLNWGLAAAIFMALTPWWWHYSRISFEPTLMLALFLVAVACLPKKLTFSALFFGLTIWAYSTAKFFVPVFILALLLIYRSKFSLKRVIFPGIILALVSLPPLWLSLFGTGGTRFNEIAIFTDPTTNTEVKFTLEQGQISSGIPREVGLSPRVIDRLAQNKFIFWFSSFSKNYLSAFSPEFLFIKGDPNLRHSPGKDSLGQLYLSDILPLVIGLIYLISSNTIDRKIKFIIAAWLLLAPIPSAITRDGAGHASRMLFLLPPLVFFIVAGWKELLKHKILLPVQILASYYFVFAFTYYYFSHYRWESARPFQWGFEQVVKIAQENSDHYTQVVIDTGETSALMAYLTTTSYSPRQLQASHPLVDEEIAGISAKKFGNIYILPPGNRNWSNLNIPPSTLLIHPSQSDSTVPYPDNAGGFAIERY